MSRSDITPNDLKAAGWERYPYGYATWFAPGGGQFEDFEEAVVEYMRRLRVAEDKADDTKERIADALERIAGALEETGRKADGG